MAVHFGVAPIRGQQCGFFSWKDPHSKQPATESSPELICSCGKPTALRTVKKGKNEGRRFHNCAMPLGQQCKFFCWKQAATQAKCVASKQDEELKADELLRAPLEHAPCSDDNFMTLIREFAANPQNETLDLPHQMTTAQRHKAHTLCAELSSSGGKLYHFSIGEGASRFLRISRSPPH